MSRSQTEPVVLSGAPFGGIDAEAFRRTCARFATGIAVATVKGRDSQPYGLTINSFTSVSCCPPLILICIDYRCSLLPHFRANSWFGVNILDESQQDVSARFALREGDRFLDTRWHWGRTGAPLLDSCIASLECGVSQVVEAGDHAILLAEVVRADWMEGEPLIYYGSEYRKLLPK